MGSCPSTFRAQFTPVSGDGQVTDNEGMQVKEVKENNAGKRVKREKMGKPKDMCDNKAVTKNVESSDDCAKNDIPLNENATLTNGASAPDGDRIQPLIVDFVELCITENAEEHHTSAFKAVQRPSPRLVIRRGSAFNITVVLNRPFNIETDVLCLVFTAKGCTKPSYSQGTEIILPVLVQRHSSDTDVWRVTNVASEDCTLNVQIIPSSDAIVGEWTLEADSRLKDEKNAVNFHYKVSEHIVILFNPWCKDDTVYLSEPELREEYVLCDSGLIWRGCHNHMRTGVWNYGQFEEGVLECVLYMLTNLGKLSAAKRADPVHVVRHLSNELNSDGKKGVLMGNWSGKYRGGTPPANWCSSHTILQKFYKTKKPVKFGQCWTYSGLLTTACRALGIPSRPVTCFSTVHDAHNGMTVDCFYDKVGKPVESMNTDSIWSFHVWSEVWMSRPDLEPGKYEGWQAVDLMSQHDSLGNNQCGPASVVAIRNGEILKTFDTEAFFSKLNAHRVYWRYVGLREPLKFIRKSNEEVGLCLSTKAVGRFEREDITHEYKCDDCPIEEREFLLKTLKQYKNALSRYILNEDLEDVDFTLLPLDCAIIGEPFTVRFKAINKRDDDSQYTVNVSLRVYTSLYNGRLKSLVKEDEFEIQLAANTEKEMTMMVSHQDYGTTLEDQCTFVIVANAHIRGKAFDYCIQDDFCLRIPDVCIEVDDEELTQNKPFTAVTSFKNPLPKPLKNGTFSVEGPGLGNPQTMKIKGEIKSGGEAKAVFKVTPTGYGSKVITAKFESKDLSGIDGFQQIFVKATAVDENDKEVNSHL